jgi:hypothetical protein
MRLPLTGGCNCGAVRYEVSEPLVRVSDCHCKRCQRRSVRQFVAYAVPWEPLAEDGFPRFPESRRAPGARPI